MNKEIIDFLTQITNEGYRDIDEHDGHQCGYCVKIRVSGVEIFSPNFGSVAELIEWQTTHRDFRGEPVLHECEAKI